MGVGMGLASPQLAFASIALRLATPARECGSRTLTAATGSGPLGGAGRLGAQSWPNAEIKGVARFEPCRPPLLNLRPYRLRGYLNLCPNLIRSLWSRTW
jgi:hypothetical protein